MRVHGDGAQVGVAQVRVVPEGVGQRVAAHPQQLSLRPVPLHRLQQGQHVLDVHVQQHHARARLASQAADDGVVVRGRHAGREREGLSHAHVQRRQRGGQQPVAAVAVRVFRVHHGHVGPVEVAHQLTHGLDLVPVGGQRSQEVGEALLVAQHVAGC